MGLHYIRETKGALETGRWLRRNGTRGIPKSAVSDRQGCTRLGSNGLLTVKILADKERIRKRG